ncbi:MAG: nuclear transport factor 2 family protein [Flavobacteriales bacterium]|nr:nuclear transport factor 2 family protein [Flavobacteriales bacterium]
MILHLQLLLGLALAPMASFAQADPPTESSVLRTIDRFFASMTAQDSAAMSATLIHAGTLQIVSADGSEPVVVTGFEEYLKRLVAGKERLVERYWDPVVRVDGPIAVATMRYDFHINGRFSHCGIDVFTLVLGPDGWRIGSVSYTRRTEGCELSPVGPLRE